MVELLALIGGVTLLVFVLRAFDSGGSPRLRVAPELFAQMTIAAWDTYERWRGNLVDHLVENANVPTSKTEMRNMLLDAARGDQARIELMYQYNASRGGILNSEFQPIWQACLLENSNSDALLTRLTICEYWHIFIHTMCIPNASVEQKTLILNEAIRLWSISGHTDGMAYIRDVDTSRRGN